MLIACLIRDNELNPFMSLNSEGTSFYFVLYFPYFPLFFSKVLCYHTVC